VKLDVEIGELKNGVIGYFNRRGLRFFPNRRDSFSVGTRRVIHSLRSNDNRDVVLGAMMDRLRLLEECIPLEDKPRENAKLSDDVKILAPIPVAVGDGLFTEKFGSQKAEPNK